MARSSGKNGTHLETKADAAGSDTARCTPATIWQPGNNDTASNLTAPEEACFDDAEDCKSLCIVEDSFRDGVQGSVRVMWVGEESLEDLCCSFAFLWK